MELAAVPVTHVDDSPPGAWLPASPPSSDDDSIVPDSSLRGMSSGELIRHYRRIRNRQSAQRSRERRKVEMSHLSATNDALAAENTEFRAENARLFAENASLIADNAHLRAEIARLRRALNAPGHLAARAVAALPADRTATEVVESGMSAMEARHDHAALLDELIHETFVDTGDGLGAVVMAEEADGAHAADDAPLTVAHFDAAPLMLGGDDALACDVDALQSLEPAVLFTLQSESWTLILSAMIIIITSWAAQAHLMTVFSTLSSQCRRTACDRHVHTAAAHDGANAVQCTRVARPLRAPPPIRHSAPSPLPPPPSLSVR